MSLLIQKIKLNRRKITMKKLFTLVFVALSLSFSIYAQTNPNSTAQTSGSTTETREKRKTFRVTKDQITQVQKMLKAKGEYAGAEDGKYNTDFRAAIKKFQGENGLNKSGSLNRATLEKMNIELTDAQKEIPIPANSYAVVKTSAAADTETKPRGPVFRATKDQIMTVQKMLKDGGMYTGEQTGKLDDATREGLKKYQEANGLKITGTLNKATLEKMGVELTDRQKEM
jgi:peptidoglycan hydrolase-like protein with peptidoglycan-binding domain